MFAPLARHCRSLPARVVATVVAVLASHAQSAHAEAPANLISLSLLQLNEPLYALRYERQLADGNAWALSLGAADYSSAQFSQILRTEVGLQYLVSALGSPMAGLRLGGELRAGWNSATLEGPAQPSIFDEEVIATNGSFGSTGKPIVPEKLGSQGYRLRAAAVADLRWTSAHGYTLQLQWAAGVRHSVGKTTGGIRAQDYDQWAPESRADILLGVAF